MSKVERHMAICKELNALFERKNHDYGDSFSKTYKELGIVSAVTQIMHKHHRLVELAVGAEQKVAGESIRDTLIDLANYAIMTVMELDGDDERKSQEEVRIAMPLNYHGHEVELERPAGGEYVINSQYCAICDVCCYADIDSDEYPCKFCVHADGYVERFVLNYKFKPEEKKND